MWRRVVATGEIDDYGLVKRPETGPVKPGALRINLEQLDGGTRVTFEGAIDENSDLEALFAKLGGNTTFDMKGVERVNSMGVHRWIPLVTRFSSQHPLVIENISYALVQNANVVANLFGAARVRSCMAPYFCPGC